MTLSSRIEAVLASPDANFGQLLEMSGLSPESDLRGCDLRGVDFGELNVKSMDLSNCDLRGANLSKFKGKLVSDGALTDKSTMLPVIHNPFYAGHTFTTEPPLSPLRVVENYHLPDDVPDRVVAALSARKLVATLYGSSSEQDLYTVEILNFVTDFVNLEYNIGAGAAPNQTVVSISTKSYISNNKVPNGYDADQATAGILTGDTVLSIKVRRIHSGSLDYAEISGDRTLLRPKGYSDGVLAHELVGIIEDLGRDSSRVVVILSGFPLFSSFTWHRVREITKKTCSFVLISPEVALSASSKKNGVAAFELVLQRTLVEKDDVRRFIRSFDKSLGVNVRLSQRSKDRLYEFVGGPISELKRCANDIYLEFISNIRNDADNLPESGVDI